MAKRPITDIEYQILSEAITGCDSSNQDGVDGIKIYVGDRDIPIGGVKMRVKAIGGNPPSDWLSNTVAFTGSVDPDTTLGVLYDKQSWNNFDDFDIALGEDTKWEIDGDILSSNPTLVNFGAETGQPGYLFLDYLVLKKIRYCNDVTLKIEVNYQVTDYINSTRNPVPPESNSRGGFVMSLVGANPISPNTSRFIKGYISSNDTYDDLFTQLKVDNSRTTSDLSESLMDFDIGDFFKITIELFPDGSKKFTYENVTKNLSSEVVLTMAQVDFNIIQPQFAYVPARGDLSGTYKINYNNIKITSSMLKNPYILCVGDSKTFGGTIGIRYGEKLADLLGRTRLIYGGSSNRTLETIRLTDYLTEFEVSPQIITLNIGRNDLAFSVPTYEWQDNYVQLVADLKNLNPSATFIHVLPIREVIDGNTTDQTVLLDFINTTFPSDLRYDPDDYGWNPETMTNDNVHPNSIGTDNLSQGLFTFINSI